MKVVVCIGGLDPAGRAGLLADARAVEALGARPVCIAAALTFQSSLRVDGFVPVDVATLLDQLEPILRDEPVGAVKIGQLGEEANARALADRLPDLPIVLDTPLVSSSGAALFTARSLPEAYAPLLARATLVTPNAPEAFMLAGRTASASRDAAEDAARSLGPRVLLKGGHLAGERVVDVLLRGVDRDEFSSPRVEGRFRGTGCRLASAIAARLALGDPLEAAIIAARTWLVGRLALESRGRR